jgi:hypothetical protein
VISSRAAPPVVALAYGVVILALLASLCSQKPLKVVHLPIKLEPGYFRHLDQLNYVRAAAADRAGGAVLDPEGDQVTANVLGYNYGKITCVSSMYVHDFPPFLLSKYQWVSLCVSNHPFQTLARFAAVL